jgi:hypothetical protein
VVVEVKASRAPELSVTTVAVTPSDLLLMVAASWSRVSEVPSSVGMDVVVEPTVILMLPEGSVVELLGSVVVEYQEPAEARLLMVTLWLLAAVPVAAVAVSKLVLELFAVNVLSAPVVLCNAFSASVSEEASLLSWLIAEV